MSETRKTACKHCGGQKQCTSCGGTGLVDRIGFRMSCAVCSGSGRCLPCGGTGEVEAADDEPDNGGRDPPPAS